MDSNPRKWVLKPLSRLLQPSDLRSITGPAPDLDKQSIESSVVVSQQSNDSQDVLVSVQRVAISQDGNSSSDEWQPSSPSSSSGSHCGFYSFVDDPKSPEAEKNEVWMVSPQRHAQLATLKEEKGFRLQTYSSSKKPESLFSESNGDLQYKGESYSSIRAMDNNEEKRLRKEIIRSQAPRRNPAEDLGASLSFGHVKSIPEVPHSTQTGAIDEEQITFGAAREKFLRMEQDCLASIPRPIESARIHLNPSLQQFPDAYGSRMVDIYCSMDVSDDTRPFKAAPKGVTHSQKDMIVSEKNLRKKINVLDSGFTKHLVEGAGSFTSDDDLLNIIQVSQTNKSRVLQETPIEREIRLSQEREEDLRQSRGLKHRKDPGEIVEINTKHMQLPLTPVRLHQKNKVSLISYNTFQRENQISEKPLQWGPLQEQDSPDPPLETENIGRNTDPDDENKTTKERTASESESDVVVQPPCCPHKHPEEVWFYQTNPTMSFSTTMDQEALDSSKKMDSPISLMPASVHETCSLSWRKSLESTGLQSRGKITTDFIEKEIEEALRREQELRELRESIKKTHQPLFSPTSLAEQASNMAVKMFYPAVDTERSISISSSSHHLSAHLPISSKPWTSLPSPASSAAQVQPPLYVARGLTETRLQDFDGCQARELEENSYAGIQLVDDINNEGSFIFVNTHRGVYFFMKEPW
ncbi:mitotic interactor and substrate of PLK1 isoform X2 [Nothobranchius furzeri]|uniref:mitotic interactor and substrate of PLK1 isoform X2 n=1 Tax=Nothobranchius furzeri TaxID=105023 RepID=UPI002403A437|nr:uncharacterized protein misp isoform X2 [Nothobranchius furzeri]